MLELPDAGAFYEIVWLIVRQIPEGEVATYGQIAAMIPPPTGVASADYSRLGARWVGDAMNAISRMDDPDIPWHRVVNGKGMISLPEASVAASVQRGRLRHEDVEFDTRERIPLDVFGWNGPSESWLKGYGLRPPPLLREPSDDKPQQMSLF